MNKSASQLSDAGAALCAVGSEIDLMKWHDVWMSTDEYTSMSDDDAKEIEGIFQTQSELFSGTSAAPKCSK
jgi:hypothetical protein